MTYAFYLLLMHITVSQLHTKILLYDIGMKDLAKVDSFSRLLW